MSKIRLDQLVFDRGFAESREKAKAIVMSGAVFVNGQKADKPGMSVSPECELDVRGTPLKYVSRGGLKLEKALKVFPVCAEGKICIDCGASTGGFTDCLLQNGAVKVYACDVGHAQLAEKLKNDKRVVDLEGTHINALSAERVGKVGIITCDVSFISLRHVLPYLKIFADTPCDIICLFKPQFEYGKKVKNGVIKDEIIHKSLLENFITFAEKEGFIVINTDVSPILGGDGNKEFLLHLQLQNAD